MNALGVFMTLEMDFFKPLRLQGMSCLPTFSEMVETNEVHLSVNKKVIYCQFNCIVLYVFSS